MSKPPPKRTLSTSAPRETTPSAPKLSLRRSNRRSSLNKFHASPLSSPSEDVYIFNPKALRDQADKIKIANPDQYFTKAKTVIQSSLSATTNTLDIRTVTSQDQLFRIILSQLNEVPLRNDGWSTVKYDMDEWQPPKQNPLVDITTLDKGYAVEWGLTVPAGSAFSSFDVIYPDRSYRFYKFLFDQNDKEEYFFDVDKQQLLAVCMLFTHKLCMLFTPKQTIRFVVETEDPVKLVFGDDRVKKCTKNEPVHEELLKIEKLDAKLYTTYKFGVLYIGPDDQTESDVYSHMNPPSCFYTFLDLIASRVNLQGFKQFAAGLDVKNNTTGKQSYFTIYQDMFHVMFHVGPLLPSSDTEQFLERKRHVGNDVVVLLFIDPSRKTPFDISKFLSHFNSAFFLVKPATQTVDGVVTQGYEHCYVCKELPPVPPYFTTSWAPNTDAFRDVVLRKLINAERVAMDSLEFQSCTIKMRKTQLDIISRLF